MSDELERRAAHGAQVHAQQVEARRREHTTRPSQPELNDLAKAALLEAVRSKGLDPDALVFLLTLLAVVVAGLLLREDIKLAVVVGVSIAIPGIVGTIIAMLYRRARQLRAALGWFDALPFAIDRRDYLALLGQERPATRVELQIVFAAPPTSQEMETFANAASGSAAIAHREWHANFLTLTSVPLRTSVFNPGTDRGSYSTNRQAHAWMLGVTDGALRLIHQRRPIERVAVKMESISMVS